MLLLTSAPTIAQEDRPIDKHIESLREMVKTVADAHGPLLRTERTLQAKIDAFKRRIDKLAVDSTPLQTKIIQFKARAKQITSQSIDTKCRSCVDAYNVQIAQLNADRHQLDDEEMRTYGAAHNAIVREIIDFNDSLTFHDNSTWGSNGSITFVNHTIYQLWMMVDGRDGCVANPGMSCTSTVPEHPQHIEAKFGQTTVIERTLGTGISEWIVCAGEKVTNCR
jgi:hypothetical protein